MKNRKGLTILEVLLTLSLISIIIMIGFNFLYFGNKAQSIAIDESQYQARTRLISEYINNITRYSTKAHTIPKSSFQHSEDGIRDPITSYIGITKDGHVVIDEPGLNEGDPRKLQYLAKQQDGINYEIYFDKVYGSDGQELDNILSFSIYGNKNGKKVEEIVSNIEIMNSIQIDHLGTVSDPAVALAFTKADPGNQQWIETTPDAYVTLVLDKSDSMYTNSINGIRRIDILKEKSEIMINRLAALEFNIYVSIVPFSDNANNPSGFYNVSEPAQRNQIINLIKGISTDGLTNTGDGIRRGFYKLKNEVDQIINDNPEKNHANFTQHMLVLIDGATNRKTNIITNISYQRWDIFKLFPNITRTSAINTDANVTNETKIGALDVSSQSNNDYVIEIGNKVKGYVDEENNQLINTFVVGFTADGTSSLQTIGNAINAKKYPHGSEMKPYILANNADELDFAFEQFTEEVTDNLWYIMRPQLWPKE